MEQGIKPVYVFDGKPPQLKGGELKKRADLKKKAEADMAAAKAADDMATVVKFERRQVRVTKEQNNEAMKLLELMGVPVIRAPGEAEAQCAELCKAGLVYATATEDMDALTFGTPRQVRHMLASKERLKKFKIHEYNLANALEGLGMSMDEFIDLCILLGCDYTDSIKGIGPTKAFKYLKDYKSIEKLLPEIKDVKTGKGNLKFTLPESFMFAEARSLFQKPEVTPGKDIKLEWNGPDREACLKFLVDEKGFNRERMERGLDRLKKCKNKGNQKRLDSFFGVIKSVKTNKRKKPDSKTKGKKNAKKKKTK